jgi:hypothetical protein
MRRWTTIPHSLEGKRLLSKILFTDRFLGTSRLSLPRLLGSYRFASTDPNEINVDPIDDSKPTTKSFIDEIRERQRKPSVSEYGPPQTSVSNGGSLSSNLLGTNSRKASIHSTIPLKTESSLFDVFSVPEPPPLVVSQKRSPNAFPEEAVVQYWEVLEPIIQSGKFIKKHTASPIAEQIVNPVRDWLRLDEPGIIYDLPTFQQALKGGIHMTHKGELRPTFQAELEEQAARFREHFAFDPRQAKLVMMGFHVVTSMCARHGKGLPVEVIWEKIKESGMITKELLHNLLYVSATFSTGSVRSRRKRRSKYGHLAGIASILDVLDDHKNDEALNSEVADEEDLVDLTDEIAIFHDLLYEPTEQSINVRVKLLVAQGKAKEAEKLLDDNSKGEAELRLRAYTPVLRLFIELNDVSSALMLFRKMKNMPSVHLDVEAYIHLIAGLTEKGCFRAGAEPIASALELGYKNAAGPKLFDELVQEMATAIFEIPESATKRLYNALGVGVPNAGLNEEGLASLNLVQDKASDEELFASRVYINPATGLCPRSGVKLRLIHLQEKEKRSLVEKVLKLAVSVQGRFEEAGKFSNRRRSDEHLVNFCSWLDQRQGRPFTIFVDGANVGYYHQNFEDGRFCYHQLKFVVDELERQGENPLIVLPYKYSWNIFNVSQGAPGSYQRDKQVLTKEEIMVRDNLVRFGKVFFVPGGHLGTLLSVRFGEKIFSTVAYILTIYRSTQSTDDFYWIVSSVSAQTISRAGKDLTVLPGNVRGQWPGTRPVLVTNDQMRDHQMDLLDPFLFRRWYSNYIVNYTFAAFVEGRCTHPGIGFSPADFFSREIQSSTDANGSTVWHFPITNRENEWFCCRIPVTPADSTSSQNRDA